MEKDLSSMLLCDAKNTECFRVWCLQSIAAINKEFDESLADKKKRKVMRKIEPYDTALNLLFAFQLDCKKGLAAHPNPHALKDL